MEQTFGSGKKMTENTGKKKTFFEFVKEHKKEIVIGSVVVCAVIAVGVVIYKNGKATSALKIKEVVAKGLKKSGEAISVRPGVAEAGHERNLPSIKPIIVSEHLRNLPDSRKPSRRKIEFAARRGISLGDHQTIVDSYAKTYAC